MVHNFDMRTKSIFRLITFAAWASIIFIAYATLARVGFVYSIYYKLSPFLMRPEMKTFAHVEHIIAFAFVGALFGLSYPRRTLVVCCIVLGAALLLEILQTLTPNRHGNPYRRDGEDGRRCGLDIFRKGYSSFWIRQPSDHVGIASPDLRHWDPGDSQG
jgi:hypothetical protein